MSKAHVPVSVYALLLLGLESVEVSETRIKANAFYIYAVNPFYPIAIFPLVTIAETNIVKYTDIGPQMMTVLLNPCSDLSENPTAATLWERSPPSS